MGKSRDKKLTLVAIVNNPIPELKAIATKKRTLSGIKSEPKERVKKETVPKIKKVKCYIHKASLKEFPKIQISQIHFELFECLEEPLSWCEEHCISYEIRDLKMNTLSKK